MKDDLVQQIALTLIEGIGDVNAKALLAYCGSAEEIFRHKKGQLQKIPGIGEVLAKSVVSGAKDALSRAEKEVAFISRYKIRPLFFTSEEYPWRLKHCSDGPVMLYYRGTADLNAERIVSVVGTRRPSEYGRQKTQDIIRGLQGSGIVVVSGLAYGVDILAHKWALDSGLDTVGVLAHGLDRLYPQSHDRIARKMVSQGGLLTDFMSGTNPDAVNFPKRNRIVAGLCDALIVVESKRTGGSLITATIAGSYNKDVFAVPGRAGDALAEGCNGLIKRNKAVLVEHAEDVLYGMQWQSEKKHAASTPQIPLQINLSTEEKTIMGLFTHKRSVHIDELCQVMQLPVSKLSGLLLQLEFSNLIKSLPGKVYERA